jgi:hypothetical protein
MRPSKESDHAYEHGDVRSGKVGDKTSRRQMDIDALEDTIEEQQAQNCDLDKDDPIIQGRSIHEWQGK